MLCSDVPPSRSISLGGNFQQSFSGLTSSRPLRGRSIWAEKAMQVAFCPAPLLTAQGTVRRLVLSGAEKPRSRRRRADGAGGDHV